MVTLAVNTTWFAVSDFPEIDSPGIQMKRQGQIYGPAF